MERGGRIYRSIFHGSTSLTTGFTFAIFHSLSTLRSMLILLTNDDGIYAPGILAMYRELIHLGEVIVVAPASVQSATGHGITITTPLLTSKVTIENGFTGIAVDGRPADCVKLAINQLLPRRPVQMVR